MFGINKTRTHRVMILKAMVAKVDEIMENPKLCNNGLCNILIECTGEIEFYKYFRNQKPTSRKHKMFYDKDRRPPDSSWWWDLKNMSIRKTFLLYLIDKNKPFKLF